MKHELLEFDSLDRHVEQKSEQCRSDEFMIRIGLSHLREQAVYHLQYRFTMMISRDSATHFAQGTQHQIERISAKSEIFESRPLDIFYAVSSLPLLVAGSGVCAHLRLDKMTPPIC